MITITATIQDNVSPRLAALPEHAAEAQRTVIKALGDRYVLVLRDETPRGQGENPGQLAAAYQTEEHYSAFGASYLITNTQPYLRYVIDGRGPVEAHAGGMLRFVIDGEVIFRKRVGPAEPNDFPARARARMEPEIAAARQELPGLIVRSYRA
jgi:hypothetical protein